MITSVLSVALIALGAAIIVRTAAAGGGLGLVLGALFVLAGAGRLYVQTRLNRG